MYHEYVKTCFNINPYCKLHFSQGVPKSDSAMYYLHYDENLIIEYFRKGESIKRIEGNVYNIRAGDLIFTTPPEMHVPIQNEGGYTEKISLHIGEALLSAFGGNRTVFFDTIVGKKKGVGNLISSELVQELGLDVLMNQCLNYAQSGSLGDQVLFQCKAIELLSLLSKLIEAGDPTVLAVPSSNENVNEMINYINRHYTENVTLDILAEKFHFSKYYISHLFRDYVGVSPYEYLITRRLYLFNDLLRQKHSIRQTCFAVGFNNYSNFFRIYKKHFGITPQQFKLAVHGHED